SGDAPGRGQDAVEVFEEAGEEFRGRRAGEAGGGRDRDRVIAGRQDRGANAVVVQDPEAGAAGAGCRRGAKAQRQDREQRRAGKRMGEPEALLPRRGVNESHGPETYPAQRTSSAVPYPRIPSQRNRGTTSGVRSMRP